jgi:protein-L-isoaspartate O-methyltransferase
VLEAMLRVPRHLFVPAPLAALAYHDTPLPIGFDKTISQPFICALMTDLLAPGPHDAVLEVGTGLGYQTAVLAELAGGSGAWRSSRSSRRGRAAPGAARLLEVGIRVGDGSRGWAEHAPFDKILVAAGAERVPPALLEQLKPGGRWSCRWAPPRGSGSRSSTRAGGRARPRAGADPGAVQPARDGRLTAATSISEMAATERIDRGYLGRILQLTLLSPTSWRRILAGRQPEASGKVTACGKNS